MNNAELADGLLDKLAADIVDAVSAYNMAFNQWRGAESYSNAAFAKLQQTLHKVTEATAYYDGALNMARGMIPGYDRAGRE